MAKVRPQRPSEVLAPAPTVGQDPGPVDSPNGGEPVKLAHGTLWRSPDGGLVLAYQVEGSDVTERRVIPAGIVKMMANGGSPMAVLKAMTRGK